MKLLTIRIAILSVGLLLISSCQSEQNNQMSISENQRRELPREAVGFLFQAEDALKQNAFWSALAYTDSVAEFNPDLADLHFLRGRIYADWNRPALAESSYVRAIEIDPEYRGAHLNLGNVYLTHQKYEQALDMYKKAQNKYPTSNVFFQLGRAYAELGKTDSARMAYERAIELDSTNSTAYMWLGQLLEDEGENEKALQYTRNGYNINPDNLNYKFLLSVLLMKTDHIDEAIPHLKDVTEKWPWHVGAHYNLGQAYMQVGMSEEGQRFLSLTDSLQREMDKLEELEDLATMMPNQTERWINLGDAYRTAGRLGDSKEAYTVALGNEPWNLAIRGNLATLNMAMGDTLGAISQYRTILQIDPSYADVWLNLGVAYANIGRIDYARECWNNALLYDENLQMARDYLAKTDSME